MKRRFLPVLVLALLFPSFLFAQGGKEAGSVPASQKDVTVSIMSTWSGDSPGSVIFRNKLSEIDAADNGIKVDQEMIGDETSYYNKLRTRFATGEFPNIFEDFGGARSYDYVKSGVLVDLRPYLDADPQWANDFMNVIEDWEYSDYPGSVYGVPTAFYVVGIFYNKAIFAKLGLEPPKTIEEFTAVCDKLLAAGYIPMPLGEKDSYRAGHLLNNLVLKAYGSEAVTALGNRTLAYDDPKMIRLYKMISDFNKKGYFGPNAINKDNSMARTDFHAGKSAMQFDGTWYLGTAAKCAIADDMGFIPFPTIDPAFAGSWQGGNNGGLSVVNTGDKQAIDKAVQVVKALTNSEFAKAQQAVNGGGIYPVKFTSDTSKVSAISIEVSKALDTSKEFRTDIQNYDINTKMLETVRMALQGLFVGKTPEQCAQEIMTVVNAGN
ncbi:extracellular solute-binding protein [uncultured Sphaerochaeta sp.]|uniref:ABC transporter substrate-binding protein n=1 Tax=uncultured Sphaerochaeta sp. TaxID=886478 RepID=UPI002A0A4A6C|nr:extracellular solute-binding protein [uncultured Sphaerochaeta sp.]